MERFGVLLSGCADGHQYGIGPCGPFPNNKTSFDQSTVCTLLK